MVVRRVYSPEVVEDGSPLPLMDNCKIEPIVMKEGKLVRDPKATVLSLFPDPGCQETLISESMVSRLGLQVNPSRTKRIQGVTGGPSEPCRGSASFQLTYDGQVTNVKGLVTDVVTNEILLSLETLKRLGG